MSLKTVNIRKEATTFRMQIDRPEARNSLNGELMADLDAALKMGEADPAVQVVVIEGLAEVFCTGMDFDAATQGDSAAMNPDDYYQYLVRMSCSSKVIVALVSGKVNAGGMGLVAASDLVLAGEGATFGLSELLFGLLPACVLPFLIRRIGFQRARWLSLTTKPISAAEAYRIGLADEVGKDPERLLRRQLTRLTCLSPSAVGRLKSYMDDLWIMRAQTRELAVATISSLMEDPEVQGKIRRFVTEGVYPWQR